MKREAIGHTKMKRLCRRLDIPLWQAVGLLETLWGLTAREAPRGDIGKLSDEDIALAIDYRGDESKLVEALIGSGWLDRDPIERLVIHDWADHADDAVHMRLARARQFFAGGRAPKLTRLTGKERDTAHEYYTSCTPEPAHETAIHAPDVNTTCAQTADPCAPPEPEPLPEPEPEPHTARPARPSVRVMPRAADMDSKDDPASERFEKAWDIWPLKVEKDAAAQAWISLVTKSQEAAVFACIGRFLASDQAARNVVGKFGNWLFQAHRDGWAGDWPQTKEQQRQQQIDRDWGGARAGRWSNA